MNEPSDLTEITKALLIIDMQNDFIEGPLGTEEAREIIPKVVEKIKKATEEKIDVIATQDMHSIDEYFKTVEGKTVPFHCDQCKEGSNIIKEINLRDLKLVYPKRTYAMRSPDAQNLFYKYSEIEIIGLCTDICVISNALLLRSTFPETKITVDASCCAGTTLEKHIEALDVMKSCSIDVINDENYILDIEKLRDDMIGVIKNSTAMMRVFKDDLSQAEYRIECLQKELGKIKGE